MIIVTVELLEHLLHRLLVNLVAAKACDGLLELHHVECTLGDCLAGTVDEPLVDTGVSFLKVSGYLHELLSELVDDLIVLDRLLLDC